ncbi:amidoligase family protein [Arenibaculum pallidiluteum]|uniref:amidoligase family protein n=1 Tax=Arenibaculum pallidiluteum TaxID=2812559 RepID=UPI001A957F66|nr:amidoligase family protein [Arenibaculum pallidiluteum]
MPLKPAKPPVTETADGARRRVGVELEFTGLDARTVAALLAELVGGEAVEKDPHAFKVVGSSLGDISVELDMMAAHPKEGEPKWNGVLRGLLGHAGSVVMPYEMSFAPLHWDRLAELDGIFDAMRRRGARGTEASLVNAFGLHLNPEIADCSAEYLTDHLKAFVVLEPWLRHAIRIDIAREIAPYIERFPPAYAARVADPGYRPDLTGLIEDYLAANPSRNRSLDMLPVFAWLDRDRIASRVPDAHVRPRPTFHYRLPNSYLGDPGWSIVPDWNRWIAVEWLAADRDRLERMGAAFVEGGFAARAAEWVEETHAWLQA